MAVTSNIISKIGNKMAPKSTIVSRLAATQADLKDGVVSARIRVSNLSDQITDLNIGAESDQKKAAAIGEALTILNNAGVEV
jgi:hypothetical protein